MAYEAGINASLHVKSEYLLFKYFSYNDKV